MTLAEYIRLLNESEGQAPSGAWYDQLRRGVDAGRKWLEEASAEDIDRVERIFNDWVRTEELKAWYGEPENDSLFQGSSVSSLTIPCVLSEPLRMKSIEQLEEVIADKFISNHDRLKDKARQAIIENIDDWIEEGLFYGLVIGSKILSQAFGLIINYEDVVFEVDGMLVDPHQITSFPEDVRKRYFLQCKERIECFESIEDLTQTELETSLVLADISKPRLEEYHRKLMLAPIRCNEIAAQISRRVTLLINEKSDGRIHPRSLMVTIYDTDTPYTYHQITGYYGRRFSPVLPGLMVLGCSGTIDAFRWLYAYRVSLVAQKIMKSSLYSEVDRRFVPFVYFGVLVQRDAEILLDLDNLSALRYRGNLSPYLEYCFLVGKILDYLKATAPAPFDEELDGRLH
jgi:hypothetical protein